MSKAKYKEGDIVQVTWNDAAGFVNVSRSKAATTKAINIGRLVKLTKTEIILEAGVYVDDGPDPTGDYTAIPRGWIDKVRVIEEGE